MTDAIYAERIRKSYGDIQAVDGVDLRVHRGELFGVIGPDGAGKTTLFRILSSLLIPEAGQANVLGLDTVHDYRALRRRIGYMPGRFSLYPDLSVEENLNFFASVFGVRPEESDRVIGPIYRQIAPFRTRRAGQLSGGMKQKLALSCALVHQPELLILDEPTTGVDAVSRVEFWEVLRQLKSGGMTVVVSTPYMDEAAMCDRVAMMQGGKFLTLDEPVRIAGRFPRPLFSVRADRGYAVLNLLRQMDACDAAYPSGAELRFVASADGVTVEDIRRFLSNHDVPEAVVSVATPTFEDMFMYLMRDHGNGHSS